MIVDEFLKKKRLLNPFKFSIELNVGNTTYEVTQIDQDIDQVIDLVQYQPKDLRGPQVE
jgi:hypothetical protein